MHVRLRIRGAFSTILIQPGNKNDRVPEGHPIVNVLLLSPEWEQSPGFSPHPHQNFCSAFTEQTTNCNAHPA